MKKAFYSIFILYFSFTFTAYCQEISINSDRLHESLMKLSTYGKNEKGGSDRQAYTIHDLQAREYVKSLMKEAGLQVSVDFAGNIIGRKAGKNAGLKPIAFGSHIDEVPNGGDYDGPVGSMGAIEVVKTLTEKDIDTEHSLEVIIFTNEEGGVVGSRALVGALSKEALQVVSSSGLTQYDGCIFRIAY
jgi:beta-ureidopropionase / N-carbamoyl-L-amino-acid hydrolase